jgi:hypothetical protein
LKGGSAAIGGHLAAGSAGIAGAFTAGSAQVAGSLSAGSLNVLDGPLGVGTGNPAYPLDVNRPGEKFPMRVRGGNDPDDPDKSVYLRLEHATAPSSWGLAVGADGHFALHQIGAADRITVDSSGRVGIGTVPNAALHVTSVDAGAVIRFYRAGGSGAGELTIDNRTAASTADMVYTPVPNPGVVGGGHAFYANNGTSSMLAFGITKDGDTTVKGTLSAKAIACAEGYAHVGGDKGTCIGISPADYDAGCYGDECIDLGMRSCSCYEIGRAYAIGRINATTANDMGGSGEYCLSAIGHCQGHGGGCEEGTQIQVGKIWPHLPLQVAQGLKDFSYLKTEVVALCDQTKPVTHTGFPYGAFRCCY